MKKPRFSEVSPPLSELAQRAAGQPWLRTYDAHEGPVQDRIWIENNPGKFDGIAERENRICPKGVARRHCPYNPKLGCDCGYRKADNG